MGDLGLRSTLPPPRPLTSWGLSLAVQLSAVPKGQPREPSALQRRGPPPALGPQSPGWGLPPPRIFKRLPEHSDVLLTTFSWFCA